MKPVIDAEKEKLQAKIDALSSRIIPLIRDSLSDTEVRERGQMESKRTHLNEKLSGLNSLQGRLSMRVPSEKITKYISEFLLNPEITKKLDMNHEYLPVKGGKVVNMRTKQVRDRVKEDYFTYEIEVEYKPTAQSGVWDKFLEDIMLDDKVMIEFLQIMFGYGITGLTEEQKFFILCGEGANGKSTLLNALKSVVGKCMLAAGRNVVVGTEPRS